MRGRPSAGIAPTPFCDCETMTTALQDYLQFLLAEGGSQLLRSLHSWRAGIAYETEFWTRWFDTKGLVWPDDYLARMAPAPVAAQLMQLIPPEVADARVLDVGAGPVSRIGSFLPGRAGSVRAVDPLAKRYRAIIAAAGVSVPLATEFAFAEDLSARFDAASFDLVTCTNALDHAMEPVWGLLEMMMITRPGGHIFLNHRRNEAEFEGYSGFHQWNFDVADGEFVIWNRGARVNMNRMLDASAQLRTELVDDHVSVIIRKRHELPIDGLDYQRRIRRVLLEAMLEL